MKKICALLLLIAALGLRGALAEASPVARSGDLAAYLDGAGGLYLPGNAKPVNRASADALVSIDAYRALFLSARSDGGRDLYMLDLGDFTERLLAEGVAAACIEDGDALYYVSAKHRTQLMRMDFDGAELALALETLEPIAALYETADGLAVELADGAGVLVHAALTDSFELTAERTACKRLLTDDCEIALTDGELSRRDRATLAEESIDSGVLDFAILDETVYYLASAGSAVRLKAYDPAAMTWQVILTPDDRTERRLTATGGRLFMMDGDRQVYSVDVAKGALVPFARIAIRDDQFPGCTVSDIRLEGMNGQLNAYAALEDAAAQPQFSFIEFGAELEAEDAALRLVKAWPMAGEETAWSLLKPAAQYSPLARGSRGDAVRVIQRPLYDLGYYDYTVDGIFGPRTDFAVRLLQTDLDRPVNGVADPELQRTLLSGRLPHYDPCVALARGGRGLRVQIMQQRLRELGYLADAADGIFGANTQRAVQLFQSECGLKAQDGATRETLRRLYAETAPACAGYIDLYPGNTGCRVLELNRRLQALYYLETSPGSAYTRQTAEAVREFQRQAGLKVTGSASADVQRRLFSARAPEAPGYIALRRGDDNDRVTALQRRLKALNYFDGRTDGYFDRATEKAVKLFQKAAGLSASGVATVRTQQLLFSRGAPEYVIPTVLGDPVITLDCECRFVDGVALVSDERVKGGSVVFSWYVEGDVSDFRVRIADDLGRVYADQRTLLSRTGVSLNALDADRLYTLTVTAYPEDGQARHVTESALRFMRVLEPEPPAPEPAVIGEPELSFETVVAVRDGVRFVAPGRLTLRWHADGEVDSYAVEILDAGGSTWLSRITPNVQMTLDSSDMAPGAVYTAFVYAIPARGTIDDATSCAARFALEDVSVTNIPPAPDDDQADAAEEGAPEPGMTESEAVPEAELIPESESVPEAEYAPETESVPEPEPAPEIDAVSEAAAAVDEPPVAVSEPLPTGPSRPEISFDNVVADDGEIAYLADDTVTLHWHSDGDVACYDVEITDADGHSLAHTATDKETLSIRRGNLKPGAVYVLIVTAVPPDDAMAEGASSAVKMALYVEEGTGTGAEPEPVVEAEPEVVEEDVNEVGQAAGEYPEAYVEEYPEAPAEEYAGEYPEAYPEEYAEEYVEEYAEEYTEAYPEAPAGEFGEGEAEASGEAEDVASAEEDFAEVPGIIWDAPLTAESEPGRIALVQDRLVLWGWLAAGEAVPGVLDEPTLRAVRDFQAYYNEAFGGILPPAAAEIDAGTLTLLMNDTGAVYPRQPSR